MTDVAEGPGEITVGNGARQRPTTPQNTPRIQSHPIPLSTVLVLRPLPRTSQLSFRRPSAYLTMARNRHRRADRSRPSRQPNPSRNEQDCPQGVRSSVTVSIAFLIPSTPGWWLTVIITLQRDNINMGAGAPANTTNYNNAKHLQFTGSTINGPVVTVHHPPQPRVRTHASMKNLGR